MTACRFASPRADDADEHPQFIIRPDTCCFNCCPVCSCEGGRGGSCIYMPFYIRTLDGGKLAGSGGYGLPAQIRNVWAGMKKECCTSADNYFVVFPKGASTPLKGALLGSTVLLDFTVFEEKEGGCFVVSW